MAKNGQKTSPKVAVFREVQAECLELRKKGYTFQQIADAMGFSTPQQAHKTVKKALKEIIREPAVEVLKLELQRLDAMFVPAFKKAIAYGSKDSINSCLNIMKRRSAFLGLDKPAKVAPTNPDGTAAYDVPTPVQFYIPTNGREDQAPAQPADPEAPADH